MGAGTLIEWTDHIDMNATGRKLGAYKTAAKRTGLDVREWMARRASGLLWCFRCDGWKAADRFSIDRSRRGGRASSCKACTSEASTASRYGMTCDELRAFRAKHKSRCGICKDARLVVVDHDHKTGRPRGLLCHNCNSAIGKLNESPALFRAALAYLEKHRGR